MNFRGYLLIHNNKIINFNSMSNLLSLYILLSHYFAIGITLHPIITTIILYNHYSIYSMIKNIPSDFFTTTPLEFGGRSEVVVELHTICPRFFC